MANIESMSANLKADISMKVKQSGVSVDLDMGMDVDLEATTDPEAAHMKGTMTMSLMGLSVEMESYSVVEDGKVVTITEQAGVDQKGSRSFRRE